MSQSFSIFGLFCAENVQSQTRMDLLCPGLVSEVQMRKKSVEILANLKNIVILDCDKDALYKKVETL